MVLRGNKGFGYVRLDWFTPDGLGTWATVACSSWAPTATSKSASTTDVGVKKQGNNYVHCGWETQSRYIDCNQMPLPFGPQFVRGHREPDAHRAETRKNACWLRNW